MGTIWITYAWADNDHNDVTYVVQELSKGATVKSDRWNIGAGRHLWEQIAKFIHDPAESDAWVIYATPTALEVKRAKKSISTLWIARLRPAGLISP
jgi:hypothetical protein